ncbi:MAG: TetR/AcrR family transcriptional regulator [Proteobacteria bacterium]|nr:TetR/AcrR family transcriptional regulator [Pseudomonadota bacterium]
MKIKQYEPQQEILDATLRLFSSKGYFGTSMQDIRKEAGVSIGAIYHYFKNKEEIATALYDTLLEQISERTDHYFTTEKTFEAACQSLIRYFFAMAEEKPHAVQFLIYARHREFLPDKMPICTAKPFELLIEAGKRAMATGEVRQMHPVVLATMVFGSPLRLILLKVDGVMELPLTDFFEESWDCIWRGVSACRDDVVRAFAG